MDSLFTRPDWRVVRGTGGYVVVERGTLEIIYTPIQQVCIWLIPYPTPMITPLSPDLQPGHTSSDNIQSRASKPRYTACTVCVPQT